LAAALLTLLPVRAVVAQTGTGLPETVSWTVVPAEGKQGGKLTLTLQGTPVAGWHVYSLQQLPLGPNPLHVALDSSDLVSADGAPSESKPVKARDAAFGFETQYYEKPFTITLPVRLTKAAAAGQQTIPVSVRFQTCNGRICQPPKTVHLSATVTVKG
jgi:hypothetical protein